MNDRHQWLKYWLYTLSIFAYGRKSGFLIKDGLSSSSRSALVDACRMLNSEVGDVIFSLERRERGYKIIFQSPVLASDAQSQTQKQHSQP